MDQLKRLSNAMKNHLTITKQYFQSTAELSKQISFFFKDSKEDPLQRTKNFGQMNADLVRVQLASIEKLFQHEVLQPMSKFSVQETEIKRAAKDRKKLLSLQSKRNKLFLNKRQEMYNVQEQEKKQARTTTYGGGTVKTSFLSKRKDPKEVARDLRAKERSYLDVLEEQETLTKQIMKRFNSLQTGRKEGTLLSSPICTLVATHYHLSSRKYAKVDALKFEFKKIDLFTNCLQK